MADNTVLPAGVGGDNIRDIDRAGVKTQVTQIDVGGATSESLLVRGQLAMAASLPVVIASNQTAIPVIQSDITASGTLTAAAQTVALALSGQSAASTQITGTWVGTLTFEASLDGTTWTAINAVSASTSSPQTTTTVNGLYRLTPAGTQQIRVNMTAFTSGSAVISLRASIGTGGVFANQILPTKITDGTNTAAIKAASTAAVAADAAMVVALSPNSPLPSGANTLGAVNMIDADIVAIGTITVTDSVVAAPAGAGAFVSGTSTSGSYVFVAAPGGDSAWNVQITGLTTGTLYFEGSLDSTNGIDGQWINVNGRQTGVVNTVLAGSATTNGMYRGNTSGFKYWRIRSVGALTGTPAIVVRLSGGIGAIFLNASIPAGSNTIGTTLGPTLTKSTQGATGYTTQDLKDAGRVIWSVASAIAGVTAVTAEALVTMIPQRDGTAVATATSHTVTAAKRLRITSMTAGLISTGAAVLSGRVSLRIGAAGAATATSPIVVTLAIPSGAALAQAGGEVNQSFPDGIEFSGAMQLGVSQVCSAATGTIWVSLTGYEY